MRSVAAVVARFFWRSWPIAGNRACKKVRKLDFGVAGSGQPSAARPGQILSKSTDGATVGRVRAQSGAFASSSTFRSATHRLFVSNILRRITNSQSYQLRRRAADQLVLGNSATFLALVGVSLASGSGLITKEDELECVCREVRHASRKTRLIEECQTEDGTEKIDFPLNKEALTREDLQFGPAVAKGCNAVVYSARWSPRAVETNEEGQSNGGLADLNGLEEKLGLLDITATPSAGAGTERNDFRPRAKSDTQKDVKFPLAVKMMFNYDIESNAFAIIKAMQREMVVAQSIFLPEETSSLIEDRIKSLPQHPNIVKMVAAFADRVPELEDSMNLYPAALPKRLNPSGFGRNMSLFLVMKRYDCSLRSFLDDHGHEIGWRTSLVLLTQLLEGISHMVRHGVCHRDLKTDNLLVDASGGFEFPLLAISDFGCCLADKDLGLKIPFTSNEIDRGGNAALMAPEIAAAKPGIFSSLDYTQADVWAAGTISFEIFGGKNPFYDDKSKKRHLDSRTYSVADLPELPSGVPPFVTSLVHSMLQRQPGKRISAELAATICQLFLWAPRSWLDPDSPSHPDTQDILQWMLTMTTKVLYESRFANVGKAHREYQLVATFLSRITLKDTKLGLAWIRQNAAA